MKVFNRGALPIAFSMDNNRVVIIEGRNSSLIIGSAEKITEISDSDWEFIKNKYFYLYELAENVIFADSKIENIKAKASELKAEKLSDEPIVLKQKIK